MDRNANHDPALALLVLTIAALQVTYFVTTVRYEAVADAATSYATHLIDCALRLMISPPGTTKPTTKAKKKPSG